MFYKMPDQYSVKLVEGMENEGSLRLRLRSEGTGAASWLNAMSFLRGILEQREDVSGGAGEPGEIQAKSGV